MASTDPRRGRPRAFAAAWCAALAAAAAHAPFVDFDVYADDYALLREVRNNVASGDAPWLATVRAWDPQGPPAPRVLRPVLEGAHAALMLAKGRDADGALAPPDPRAEHLLSLGLKAALSGLVAVVAIRLGASTVAGFFAGVVAALHPAPSNAFVWTAARGDLAWVLFVLLGVCAALPPPGARFGFVRGALVCWWTACALGCKETAVFGTAAVFAALFVARRRGVSRRASAATVAGVVVVIAGYFVVRGIVFGPDHLSYPGVDANASFASVRDLAPKVFMRLVGGRRPASYDVLPLVSSAVAWASVGVVGTVLLAALSTVRPRRPAVAAILACGASATIPVFLQSAEQNLVNDDVTFSRFLVGWTTSLALGIAIAAETSRLVRRAAPCVVIVLGLNFLCEMSAARVYGARLNAPRAPVVEALEKAGPDARLVVVAPQSRALRAFVPYWATIESLAPPFLPYDVPTHRCATRREFLESPDPAAIDRPRWSTPGPLVVAWAGDDETIREPRFVTSVHPRFDAAAPARLAIPVDADGASASVLPPAGIPLRAYPAITCEVVGDDAASSGTIVVEGGARSRVIALPPRIIGRRRFSWWHQGLEDERLRLVAAPSHPGGATSRRATAPGLRFTSVVLERRRSLLALTSPRNGAVWSLGGSTPEFVVEDRAGWPFVRLRFSMASRPDVGTLTATVVSDAGLEDDGPRRVRFDAAAGPDAPARTLRAILPSLLRADAAPIRLRIEAESAASPDGPASARSPVSEIEVVP